MRSPQYVPSIQSGLKDLLLDEVRHFPRWDRWLKFAVDNQVGR